MGTKEQVDALTGGGARQETGGEDWKAKCEALQRELNSAKVEQGRVKALDSRAKELEAELRALKSAKSKEELLASLSDESRENVAPEVQSATAEIVGGAVDRVRNEYEERFARLESEREEANQRAFMARIETAFPGFLSSVGPGGRNADAWLKYLAHNKWSVAGALQHGDFGTIDYHVRQFCNSIEVSVPSADGATATASDPGNQAGGAGVSTPKSGKAYSHQEWSALPDLAEQARDRGDYAEMKRLYAEYEKAPSEGRVK